MSDTIKATVDYTLKIGGSNATPEMLQDLMEVVVDTDLHQPNMITVRFYDHVKSDGTAATWADDSKFDLGKEIEFSTASSYEAGAAQVLFKGEITAIEPEFDEGFQAVLCVRGYDKTHRLHMGRKTRAFLKQTDSAMAQTVGGEAGVAVNVDATSETFDYVIQHNQTNMEFLRERAQRIGYEVYFANAKLNFKKAAPTGSSVIAITWGQDLLSFRPRVSAAHLPASVKAQGWNPKTKAMVTGTAPAPASSNQGGITKSGQQAANTFSAGDELVSHRFVASAGDAKEMATSRSQALHSNYVQAEGTGLGDTRIVAGKIIEIKGVGSKFSGKYYVTAATHRYSASGTFHYTTDFYITGYEPNTLSHLIVGDRGEAQHLPSAVIGLVTNNKDPEKMGRVKVKFPWLNAEVESHWARVVSPMAGNERGWELLPEVDDEVVLAFEHGDFNSPFVLGAVWNGKDKLPVPSDTAIGSDGKVNQRVFRTRAGHMLLFDDKEGAEKITLIDKTGKNEITITSSDNTLTIKGDNKMSVTIGQGGITMEAKGAISITSTSGDIKLEGTNINLKAKANCTVEGTAGVTIKNAAAEIALSGPTVNINKGALEVM